MDMPSHGPRKYPFAFRAAIGMTPGQYRRLFVASAAETLA
jgi:AraC-like DNA-binding protein